MDPVEKKHLDTLVNNNTYDVWHIGLTNSIAAGLKNLYAHLKGRGEVLVEVTDIFDHEYLGQIHYFVVYRALPNLEYLEYMWEKQVGNNGKKAV